MVSIWRLNIGNHYDNRGRWGKLQKRCVMWYSSYMCLTSRGIIHTLLSFGGVTHQDGSCNRRPWAAIDIGSCCSLCGSTVQTVKYTIFRHRQRLQEVRVTDDTYIKEHRKTYSAYHCFMTQPKIMANGPYFRFDYHNNIKYTYSHNRHKWDG